MLRSAIAVAVAVVFIGCGTAGADDLSLKSGNVPVGQREPSITVEGAAVTIFGEAQAAAPVPLQQALVLDPYPGWVQLPGCAWVGVADGTASSPEGGYVYRTTFQLPTAYADPYISLTMSSDNYSSAILNGSLIGSIPAVPKEWSQLFTFSSADAAAFRPGLNVLEFDVLNGTQSTGNPSGLLFQAQVSYTLIPEPTSVLGLLCGICGLALVRRRR